MEPSAQPTPTPPSPSIDYLNSIAPEARQQGMNPKLLWAFIGGGLVLLAVLVMMILSSGPNLKNQLQTLGYELKSLETLTTDQQPNIRSSELRRINSSLTLLLTNANHDITTPLSKNNASLSDKVPDSSPVASEFKSLSSRLDDARLNAVFDRTYARELSYQLDKILIEINDIYKNADSTLKPFLQETSDNLSPIQKQFAGFNPNDD